MLYQMACQFTNLIRKNTRRFDEVELDRIRFAFEGILSESLKFTILLIFFAHTSYINTFFLITINLFIHRPLMGGLHLKTHVQCMMATMLFYAFVLLAYKLLLNHEEIIALHYAFVIFSMIFAYRKYDKCGLSIILSGLILLLSTSIGSNAVICHIATLTGLSIQLQIGGIVYDQKKLR